MGTTSNCSVAAPAGVIRAGNFKLNIGTFRGLVQSFQLQFQRQLSRVYDLSDASSFYYVEGPSNGSVAFNSVVGPKGAPELVCSCKPETISLTVGTAVCDGTKNSSPTYQLLNALPAGLTGQGSSNDFIVVFGIQYQFTDIKTSGAQSAGTSSNPFNQFSNNTSPFSYFNGLNTFG